MDRKQTRQPRGLTFIWLAYTGFFFLDPIFEPSERLWIATLGVFALFLIVFRFHTNDACSRKTQYWTTLATFLLGVLSLPWNSGGITFFIYAAGFLPFITDSLRTILTCFALEILTLFAEAQFFHYHGLHVSFISSSMGTFILLIVGISNIFFGQQKRDASKLQMAQEEIEALAAVAERERIARDLHDVLGHTLSLIVLKAELAGRLIDRDPERAANEIAEVERTARTALAEVREAIGGYRSRGLAAEIETARRTLATAGVDLQSDATDIEGTRLTAAEETVLALALREAVTNIVRHAHARTCRLRFVTEHGTRKLIVEDDGAHTSEREGNGLRGMRERVESLGGQLLLDRSQGTRLEVDLPAKSEPVTA